MTIPDSSPSATAAAYQPVRQIGRAPGVVVVRGQAELVAGDQRVGQRDGGQHGEVADLVVERPGEVGVVVADHPLARAGDEVEVGVVGAGGRAAVEGLEGRAGRTPRRAPRRRPGSRTPAAMRPPASPRPGRARPRRVARSLSLNSAWVKGRLGSEVVPAGLRAGVEPLLERRDPVEEGAVGLLVALPGAHGVAQLQVAAEHLVQLGLPDAGVLGLAVGHPRGPRPGQAVGLGLGQDRRPGVADPRLDRVAELVGHHQGRQEPAGPVGRARRGTRGPS